MYGVFSNRRPWGLFNFETFKVKFRNFVIVSLQITISNYDHGTWSYIFQD